MLGGGQRHGPGRNPGLGRRIIQFSGVQRNTVVTSGHQDLAILEEGGGEMLPPGNQVADADGSGKARRIGCVDVRCRYEVGGHGPTVGPVQERKSGLGRGGADGMGFARQPDKGLGRRIGCAVYRIAQSGRDSPERHTDPDDGIGDSGGVPVVGVIDGRHGEGLDAGRCGINVDPVVHCPQAGRDPREGVIAEKACRDNGSEGIAGPIGREADCHPRRVKIDIDIIDGAGPDVTGEVRTGSGCRLTRAGTVQEHGRRAEGYAGGGVKPRK